MTYQHKYLLLRHLQLGTQNRWLINKPLGRVAMMYHFAADAAVWRCNREAIPPAYGNDLLFWGELRQQ